MGGVEVDAEVDRLGALRGLLEEVVPDQNRLLLQKAHPVTVQVHTGGVVAPVAFIHPVGVRQGHGGDHVGVSEPHRQGVVLYQPLHESLQRDCPCDFGRMLAAHHEDVPPSRRIRRDLHRHHGPPVQGGPDGVQGHERRLG